MNEFWVNLNENSVICLRRIMMLYSHWEHLVSTKSNFMVLQHKSSCFTQYWPLSFLIPGFQPKPPHWSLSLLLFSIRVLLCENVQKPTSYFQMCRRNRYWNKCSRQTVVRLRWRWRAQEVFPLLECTLSFPPHPSALTALTVILVGNSLLLCSTASLWCSSSAWLLFSSPLQ